MGPMPTDLELYPGRCAPNTLVSYLQLVALGLRGLAIEQRYRFYSFGDAMLVL